MSAIAPQTRRAGANSQIHLHDHFDAPAHAGPRFLAASMLAAALLLQGQFLISHHPSCFTRDISVVKQKENVMQNILERTRGFFQDEDGVTAIEYGLIAALIAILIIAGVTIIGTKLASVFDYIGSVL